MRIAIVILHYGNLQTTQHCIQSIYKNEKEKFSLIVVNNMPTVYQPKDFSSHPLKVINTGKNLGFAKGVNVGIQHALKNGAEYVLLLNNDTSVSQPVLRKLEESLIQIKSAGIAAPVLQFRKGEKVMYDMGGEVTMLSGRTSHTEVEKIISTKISKPSYVSGCCMLIKKEVFEKVGLFDEQFFLYYEDVDFCLRSRNAGFVCVVNPAVVIEHALSKAAGKVSYLATYHQIRSAILFGRKYCRTPLQKFMNKLFIIFQTFVFFKGNPSGALGGVKALITSSGESKI